MKGKSKQQPTFRDLYRSKGLSMVELAYRAGASETAVRRWERGVLPRLDQARKIADVLGVSLDELAAVLLARP